MASRFFTMGLVSSWRRTAASTRLLNSHDPRLVLVPNSLKKPALLLSLIDTEDGRGSLNRPPPSPNVAGAPDPLLSPANSSPVM